MIVGFVQAISIFPSLRWPNKCFVLYSTFNMETNTLNVLLKYFSYSMDFIKLPCRFCMGVHHHCAEERNLDCS